MQNNIMELNQKGLRREYLDIARGIGILLVVIGHHLEGYPNLTIWIYSFHMPLFFMLSGWLYAYISPKKNCMQTFILKKAGTLLFPYLVFSILIILWKYLLFFVFGDVPKEGFSDIFIRSISTYGYHALWFLPTLFLSEISVHYIECRKIPELTKYIIYLVIALLGFSISGLIDSVQEIAFLVFFLRYIGRIFLAIMFYRIGMILYSIPADRKINACIFVFSICISVSLCTRNGLVNMSALVLGNVFLYLILAITGSASIISLSRLINCSNFLSFWGRNSLIIMLTHMDFSIEIAYILLGKLRISSMISNTPTLSLIAILLELVVEAIAILIINRYFKFLLVPTKLPKHT